MLLSWLAYGSSVQVLTPNNAKLTEIEEEESLETCPLNVKIEFVRGEDHPEIRPKLA